MGSKTCDICGRKIGKILIDGMTNSGQWAVMCPSCHKFYGVGLGTGRGQKYKKDAAGDFVKVESADKIIRRSSEKIALIRIGMEMGLTRDEAEREAMDYLGESYTGTFH